MSGGKGYDTGSMTVTINESTSGSVSWSSGSTASSIASSLATTLNSSFGSILTASASGSTVNLTSLATGTSTNWPITLNVTDTSESPTYFSFSESNMSGGASSGYGDGTIYSYCMPSSSNPVCTSSTSGWAPNGNLVGYTDTVMGTWSNIKYDHLNRLSSGQQAPVSGSTQYFCWSYDDFGNRTDQQTETGSAFSNDPGAAPGSGATNGCVAGSGASLVSNSWATYTTTNRISSTNTSGSTYTPTYDAAGSIKNDGTNQYLLDAEGRICVVYNGTTYMGYLYNAEGARVAKGTVSGISSCPGSSGFGTLSNQYLLGRGGEEVTVLTGSSSTWDYTDAYIGGGGIATYDIPSGTTSVALHFNLADWLGSRRVQANTAGEIEKTWQSLPFGDGLTSSSGDDSDYKHYTGKDRDNESGNDYFGARYYASNSGRFLSADWAATAEPVPYAKLGNPQSLNLYAYVGNSPFVGIDADGHSRAADPRNFLAMTDYWDRAAEAVGGIIDAWDNRGELFNQQTTPAQPEIAAGQPEDSTAQQQMTTSAAGVAFIEGWEGWNGTVDKKTGLTYAKDDGFGNGTIGWGHNCGKCADFKDGITKDQGEALLKSDLAGFEKSVNGLGASLSQQQFDGLVSFAFNVTHYGDSTLFSNVASGTAVTEGNFTAYGHAHVGGKLVEVPSLMARRRSEYNIYANGVYDSSH